MLASPELEVGRAKMPVYCPNQRYSSPYTSMNPRNSLNKHGSAKKLRNSTPVLTVTPEQCQDNRPGEFYYLTVLLYLSSVKSGSTPSYVHVGAICILNYIPFSLAGSGRGLTAILYSTRLRVKLYQATRPRPLCYKPRKRSAFCCP